MATHLDRSALPPAPAAAAAADALVDAIRAVAASARASRRVAESAALTAVSKSVAAVAVLLRAGCGDERVQLRLAALSPCLEAQQRAADRGLAAGTSRGLVCDAVHQRGVAAKHLFTADVDISTITPSDVRRRQRGRRSRHGVVQTDSSADSVSASAPVFPFSDDDAATEFAEGVLPSVAEVSVQTDIDLANTVIFTKLVVHQSSQCGAAAVDVPPVIAECAVPLESHEACAISAPAPATPRSESGPSTPGMDVSDWYPESVQDIFHLLDGMTLHVACLASGASLVPGTVDETPLIWDGMSFVEANFARRACASASVRAARLAVSSTVVDNALDQHSELSIRALAPADACGRAVVHVPKVTLGPSKVQILFNECTLSQLETILEVSSDAGLPTNPNVVAALDQKRNAG